MRHQGGSKAIEAADVNGEKSKSGRVMTGESELKGKKNPPQSHRIVGPGRDFWRPSGPTPLLRQGYPEQAAQDFLVSRWLFSV